MQIKLLLVSTYLFISVWLSMSDAASPMDYHYKLRRQPYPPHRHPPPPHLPAQYMKKWQQHRPTRGSIPQSRPIPLQIMPTFVQPPIVKAPIPVSLPTKPTPAPVRTYWKSTRVPISPKPEKLYQTSQPINSINEYDYHIQTNNIPTNTITIKQVGEKGPIHTIPAPNLSLADKPIVVQEVGKQQQFVNVQSDHQYQVIESNNNQNQISQSQSVRFPQGQVVNLQQQSGDNNQMYEVVQQQIQQYPQTPNIFYQDMLPQDQNVQPYIFNYQRNAQGESFPTALISTDFNMKASDSDETGGEDPSGSDENIVFGEKISDTDPSIKEGSTFYTTLPNQKIADALASLQAAGQINNNLNQLVNGQNNNNNNNERSHLEIYVPDFDSSSKQGNNFNYARDTTSNSATNQIIFKDSKTDASGYNGLQQPSDQVINKLRKFT